MGMAMSRPWRFSITPLRRLAPRSQGQNVLVHPEEVFWIVFGLDLLEPTVVATIGGGDRIVRLIVAEVIHIATGADERLHLRVAVARPGHTATSECRLCPFREHQEVVALGAVRERRVTDPDS